MNLPLVAIIAVASVVGAALAIVVDQEGDEAKVLRMFQLLLGILHGEQAAPIHILPRLHRLLTVAAWEVFEIVDVRLDKVFKGHGQAFEDTKP